MASLLEEGICVVKDKRAAQRLLRDLKNSKGMSWEEIEKRAKRAKRMLEKGEKWIKKCNYNSFKNIIKYFWRRKD